MMNFSANAYRATGIAAAYAIHDACSLRAARLGLARLLFEFEIRDGHADRRAHARA